MELEKKTTILFPPSLHAHLVRVARQHGVSLGELIRRACEKEYGYPTRAERIAAARDLGSFDLPVSDPATMKAESLQDPKELE